MKHHKPTPTPAPIPAPPPIPTPVPTPTPTPTPTPQTPVNFKLLPIGDWLVSDGRGNVSNGISFFLLFKAGQVAGLFMDAQGNFTIVPFPIGYKMLSIRDVFAWYDAATNRVWAQWRVDTDKWVNVTELALTGSPLPTTATVASPHRYGDATTGYGNAMGGVVKLSNGAIAAVSAEVVLGGSVLQDFRLWTLVNGNENTVNFSLPQVATGSEIQQWHMPLVEQSDGSLAAFVNHDASSNVAEVIFNPDFTIRKTIPAMLTVDGEFPWFTVIRDPAANLIAVTGSIRTFDAPTFGTEIGGKLHVVKIDVDGNLTDFPITPGWMDARFGLSAIAFIGGILCVSAAFWNAVTQSFSDHTVLQLVNGSWLSKVVGVADDIRAGCDGQGRLCGHINGQYQVVERA